MNRLRISLAAVTALLVMAGCGSIGNVLGTPYPGNTQSLSGNVNSIDYNARRIDLNSNGYMTSVYYNSGTQFTLNNQNVSPNALRQGDYITVQAYNNGGGLIAQNVYDTGNGMASGGYPYPAPNPGNNYPNNGQNFTISGTVNYVDTTAQRIDLSSAYTSLRTNGGQGSYSIYYDSRTPVYYQGQSYSPTALERGDQISVNAYDAGKGRYTATSIDVTRNVRQQ